MQLRSGKLLYRWHFRISHALSFIASQIICTFWSPVVIYAGVILQYRLVLRIPSLSQYPKAMAQDLRADMDVAALCPAKDSSDVLSLHQQGQVYRL